MSPDIDAILRSWEYQSDSVQARITRAGDGREVVQLRLDLGLMQMELDSRPDGRPAGGLCHLLRLPGPPRRAGPAGGAGIPARRGPMRRGRPRIHAVLPPPRLLPGAAAVRAGRRRRRPHPRLHGLRPRPRAERRGEDVARALPSLRDLPQGAGAGGPLQREGKRGAGRRFGAERPGRAGAPLSNTTTSGSGRKATPSSSN